MIIDHIGFAVSSPETSIEFFSKALEPLGIVRLMEVEGWSGFGKNGKPEFWIGKGDSAQLPTGSRTYRQASGGAGSRRKRQWCAGYKGDLSS